MSKSTQRTRYWQFIVYTDDPVFWPVEFEEYCAKLGVKVAACEHYADREEDGSLKKEHIHVVVGYEGVKSLAQLQEDFGQFAANGYIEPVRNLTASLRYLLHKDNPEKYQYEVLSVLRGFTEKDFVKKEKTDDLVCFNEMLDWITTSQCFSMASLIDYARTERKDWLQLLLKVSYSSLVSSYIRSQYWANHNI